MSQSHRILTHLKAGHTLTQREAGYLFGVGRLSGRILDLRNAGHPIDTTIVEVSNRDGSTSRVARYSMGGAA